MAQLAKTAQQRVDGLLDMLMYQWQRLPEVEAQIDSWDHLDQLNFIEEWPLEEDRLKRLERYVAEGALTDEQLHRYENLQRLIDRNRPIIRRLQES